MLTTSLKHGAGAHIVFGIHSPNVSEKLLSVGSELTLDKAVERGTLRNPSWKGPQFRKRNLTYDKPRETNAQSTGCGYCGNRVHNNGDKCPAKGKQCKTCGKWKSCHSKKKKNVHTLEKIDRKAALRATIIDAINRTALSKRTLAHKPLQISKLALIKRQSASSWTHVLLLMSFLHMFLTP